jgi:hypothetical protein
MVIVAGMLPEGTRGAMIVTGHKFLLAILGLALVSRVALMIGVGAERRRKTFATDRR